MNHKIEKLLKDSKIKVDYLRKDLEKISEEVKKLSLEEEKQNE